MQLMISIACVVSTSLLLMGWGYQTVLLYESAIYSTRVAYQTHLIAGALVYCIGRYRTDHQLRKKIAEHKEASCSKLIPGAEHIVIVGEYRLEKPNQLTISIRLLKQDKLIGTSLYRIPYS